MQVDDQNITIDRAVALHKMIRLLTLATSGSGYLNFIGNEFGHPEWIDFPREGNNWSYHYCRRQWSLRDDPNLKYQQLAKFDQAMMRVAQSFGLLDEKWPYKHYEHVEDKLLVFERAGLLFVFNFNPTASFDAREIPCSAGRYRVVFDTDREEYGGRGRVASEVVYTAQGSTPCVTLYVPCRCGLVLERAGV